MKTRTILLGVLGLSAPAFAAPPDVAILVQATPILNECAAIAREIDAMKIPAGHAAANLRAATLKAAGLQAMPTAASVAAAQPQAAPANAPKGPAAGRAGAADAEAAAKAQADQAKAAADAAYKAQADAEAKEQAAQDAFEATMKAAVDRFAACGKKYQDVVPKAQAKLKEVTAANVPEADSASIGPTVDTYVRATEAFRASATRLSNDRQTQSYVAQTLETYYFK